MASAFSHLLVGSLVVKSGESLRGKKASLKLYVVSALSSAMPDLDVITFRFGIPYSHWLGHRGLTHSLFFALIWSWLMLIFFFRKSASEVREKLYIGTVLFISTASHGLIDAMTNGGRGIGFFIPFDNTRHFLPFRPIQVSPLGMEAFFSEWGLRVILSELIWIVLPCLLLWYGIKSINRSI